MKYSSLVLTHFFDPCHVGAITADAYPRVVSHRQAQSYSLLEPQGDSIDLYLACDDQRIIAAGYLARGNPYLIAAGSILCEALHDMPLPIEPIFNFEYWVDKLAIPQDKYYVAILIEEALNRCMEQLTQNEAVNEH